MADDQPLNVGGFGGTGQDSKKPRSRRRRRRPKIKQVNPPPVFNPPVGDLSVMEGELRDQLKRPSVDVLAKEKRQAAIKAKQRSFSKPVSDMPAVYSSDDSNRNLIWFYLLIYKQSQIHN
ncbi:MAG: hypothetical protein UT55_C0023G0002 [Candidatus Peregrinibacteria bacterium GW2011_GWE2_39_6]|nr:MAG: hypothetical protein UT55_C0023G0002 [Candidatus Peregrinibacteria bacterium GW2011_GWE2_39_6]